MLLTVALDPEGYHIEYDVEEGTFELHNVHRQVLLGRGSGAEESDLGRTTGW